MQQTPENTSSTKLTFQTYFNLVNMYLRGLFSSSAAIIAKFYTLLNEESTQDYTIAEKREHFKSTFVTDKQKDSEMVIKDIEHRYITVKRLESIWGVFWWLLLPIVYFILLCLHFFLPPSIESILIICFKLFLVVGITYSLSILTFIIQSLFYQLFSKMLSRILTIPGIMEIYSSDKHKLIGEQNEC